MFSQRFQSELGFLREMGREFSEHHPALAGAFSERGGDPDVERLIEGFAFLTADVKARAEDAHPFLIDALAELVAPQLLRPQPAATLVEFSPDLRRMRGRYTLSAGTPLGSRARPETGVPGRCIFRTSESVELRPLACESACLEQSSPEISTIRLRMRRAQNVTPEALAGSVTLHIAASWASASALALWFARHWMSTTLRLSDGRARALGARATTLLAAQESGSVFPWPARVPDGARRLQEYFSLPESHLGVRVDGLEAAAASIDDQFVLEFRFEGAPALPESLPSDAFRLHVVPAVNVFVSSGEPLPIGDGRLEYRVQAAGVPLQGSEVLEVKSAQVSEGGVSAGARRRVRSLEVFGAPDPGPAATSATSSYRLRRSRSPVDGALDTYITPLAGAEPFSADAVLSTELLCTQRRIPVGLRVGDVCEAIEGSPAGLTFRNISPVSCPLTPPLGEERLWRLLRQVTQGSQGVNSANALRALLRDLNLQRGQDLSASAVNDRRIEAIRSLERRAAMFPCRGFPLRGVETVITLDLDGFSGVGDAYLFGAALDVLLSAQLPLNAVHRLRIMLYPEQGTFVWQPRSGFEVVR